MRLRPALLVLVLLPACASSDWRTATRESAGIAPKAEAHEGAVVQIYAARAVRWRGWFAVHCWIAYKETGAPSYTTLHVTRWGLRRGKSTVVEAQDLPDRHWFGARPSIVADLRGAAAESAIPKIRQAVLDYPYPKLYRAWPGPNSNTFVSFIVRRVPEFGVELPPHAIGKDWIRPDFYAVTESGTGRQVSLYGVLGASAGAGEGLELNFLGLNFGVDVLRPALKLPLIGRVGMSDRPFRSAPAPAPALAGAPPVSPAAAAP